VAGTAGWGTHLGLPVMARFRVVSVGFHVVSSVFGICAQPHLHMLAVDMAEGEAEGGVTHLGSPTLSLWAWVGIYTAFAVFVVLLALAFIVLSCLLALLTRAQSLSHRGSQA